MSGKSHADGGSEGANSEHAEITQGEADVDLGKIRQDAVDIRNAVAFAERSAGGRVSLELGHAIDELAEAVERLRRAHAAAGGAGDVATDRFEPGERAFVNETDGGEVIVLATPNVRADDYPVPGANKTVAAYNAKYSECSSDDPVVQIVFVEAIEDAFGSKWTDEAILDLYGDGLLSDHSQLYAYPDTRLTTDGPIQS
jgi:hypothetical protein